MRDQTNRFGVGRCGDDRLNAPCLPDRRELRPLATSYPAHSRLGTRARYVDTFKSAAWFDGVLDRTKDVDVCRAWDQDGNLIAFGNYRLEGENRAATESELRPSSVHSYPTHPNLAWIYLFGDHGIIEGKTLVPVNDAGVPLERFEVRIGNSR